MNSRADERPTTRHQEPTEATGPPQGDIGVSVCHGRAEVAHVGNFRRVRK